MAAFTNVPNIILSVILIAYFRNAFLLFRAKKRRYNNFHERLWSCSKKKYNTTNKTVEITAIEFYRSNVFGLESGINSAPFSLSQSGY